MRTIQENRTILTFDSDYGELIFRKGYKPSAGVIYFRWKNFKPDDPAFYLIKLFEEKQIKYTNKLTIIGEKSIRQRKY